MATVKHRFAEIHQAYSVVKTEKLWASLNNADLSVVTVSSVCDKIVSGVQTGSFRFHDTLLHFQNLVLTNTNRLKTSVYLRSLSLLLQCHAQQKKFHDAVDLVLTSSPTDIMHPFIVICQQRPELCDDVFFEVDYLLAQYNDSYEYSILDTMGIFFDSVLLIAESAQKIALLNRFANVYSSTELRVELYYYLIDVLQRYPTRRGMSFYLQLVDFISAIFTSPDIAENELQSIATALFYQLLCRAYDAATYGYPSLPYLQRLDRIYEMRDICSNQPLTAPNFYFVWASLSYLLLNTQTIHDQGLVLKMMQEATQRNESFDKSLLVAILPLFQTWTEIVDGDKAAKQRKASALEILALVTANASIEIKDKTVVKNEILQHLGEHSITGAMADMIPYLFNFLDNQLDDIGMPTNSVSHIHALLFTAPYVFHSNARTRHSNLNRLAELSSITSGTYSFKFPVFLLTLYLMRNKDIMTSETFLFIYHTIIPSLVNVNDPILTAKILQTVLPMIQGSHTARDTAMAAVGFKTLVKIYERQPRVWHEVKKVMANWILHRKSTLRPDDKLSIQMELAVLTSMRDLCKTHARACAQDILPMVISLLQTSSNLNVASLALILETMCACIAAGLAEPRSMWNVAIRYIAAFAMERDQNQMTVLWSKICEFFAIVGDSDEVSESYSEFKDDVLFNYIEPLMSSENDSIRSSALTALSHFPATDIMRLLPEKSKQVTDEIIADPNDADSKVLTKLLSHELDHMRRNLFKEDAPAKPKTEETKETKCRIGAKEAELMGRFVKSWEQASTAPGVRAGYAIAVLHATKSHMSDPSALSGESMTKTKWYRCLTTSIGDIGLTDHLLVRISCLSGWVSLFETALGSEDVTFELKGARLLEDLQTRLEKSTVPGTTCNILLAITGFTLVAHRLSPSFGASCAAKLIELLCSKYIVSPGQSGKSTLVMSEEVQFAANFSLGHIAGCIIANEKLATQMLNSLLDSATASGTGRRIDAAVDLAQFARGYAASVYTAALNAWPTKTSTIDTLAKNGISTLMGYLDSPGQQVSESRALGIMMGWASMMQSKDMQDVCWLARETLNMYTEEGASKLNKGVLLGSCWITSYAAVDEEGHIDQENVDALEKAAKKAVTDTSLSQHYYHFSVSSAHLNRLKLVYDQENGNSADVISLVQREIALIKESGLNATTSIMNLGSLLGVDYLAAVWNTEKMVAEAQIYSTGDRAEALEAVANLAGVSSGSLAIGNLKNTRIAAVVCGKINQTAVSMRDAKALEEDGGEGASAQIFLSTSTEPKSYSRLSNTASYLRAVFDSLTQLVENPSQSDIHVMEILLSSLCETPGPLPPVNWFPFLTAASTNSVDLHVLCITFASHHALTSTSLMEYIISQVTAKDQSDVNMCKLLAGEIGLGKIFELGGLPYRKPRPDEAKRRGMDAVTKKMNIPPMRCIEIFEDHLKLVKKMSPNIQLIFLTTLCDHLPPITETIEDEDKCQLVKTLRDMTYYQITRPLLNSRSSNSSLVSKAIECSVQNTMQITQQELTEDTAFAQSVALAELCRLRRTTSPIQLITDAIRQLLMKNIHSISAWDQISHAILLADCASTQQKLAWVTRILDTLIVIGSNHQPENKTDILLQGLAHGLRHILASLWWWSNPKSTADMNESDAAVLPDTGYMLAHIIYLGNAYPQEQQQMIKRVLKLITLADTMGSEKKLEDFLVQVVRDCSEKAIAGQPDDEVAKIITSE